jgi:hypothetical protein
MTLHLRAPGRNLTRQFLHQPMQRNTTSLRSRGFVMAELCCAGDHLSGLTMTVAVRQSLHSSGWRSQVVGDSSGRPRLCCHDRPQYRSFNCLLAPMPLNRNSNCDYIKFFCHSSLDAFCICWDANSCVAAIYSYPRQIGIAKHDGVTDAIHLLSPA